MRMVTPDDAAELFGVIEKNREHLKKWMPWVDHNIKLEHTERFIADVQTQDERNEGFSAVVIQENRIVGVAGYKPINLENHSVEIGYWLDQDYTGRGIMTKCCRELIDYAFEALALNRISINVAVDNLRSRAIPERLGFTLEGNMRDGIFIRGRYFDVAVYSLLKREWQVAESDHQ